MNGERLCWHFGRSFSDTAELLQARINTHCLKSTTAFQAYMGFPPPLSNKRCLIFSFVCYLFCTSRFLSNLSVGLLCDLLCIK